MGGVGSGFPSASWVGVGRDFPSALWEGGGGGASLVHHGPLPPMVDKVKIFQNEL